ncbi:MAG: hypothetical protein AB7L91_16815 [Dehalococcoidia bacterium]
MRAGTVRRRADGRPICPTCVQRCPAEGHDLRPSDGWWLCGCNGSLPGHAELPDPDGAGRCAMAWRECRRCEHIEEHPAAELSDSDGHTAAHDVIGGEHRSDGFLRQDVPAGPVLPHQRTTSEHVSSEENAMVGPSPGDRRAVPVAVDVVSPDTGLVTSGVGDFSGTILRRNRDRGGNGSGYLVEDEWGEVIGRAGSYRDGAERLARHHGFVAESVEVELEYREFGGAR